VNKGIDVNVFNKKNDRSALSWACSNGQYLIVSLLLDYGADCDIPDADNNFPIHLAALNGNLDIIRLLIEKGDHTYKLGNAGKTVLHCAASKGNLDVIKYVLDNDLMEIYDNNKYTVLHSAIESESIEAIKYIIERGGYRFINNKDNQNRRPIDIAQLIKDDDRRKTICELLISVTNINL